MKTINREEFLSKVKAGNKIVHIESIDADIIIRPLPASEVLRLSENVSEGNLSQEDFTFFLIVSSVIDDEGAKLFTVEDIKDLPIGLVTELAKSVAEINNLNTEEAKDSLKKIQK